MLIFKMELIGIFVDNKKAHRYEIWFISRLYWQTTSKVKVRGQRFGSSIYDWPKWNAASMAGTVGFGFVGGKE